MNSKEDRRQINRPAFIDRIKEDGKDQIKLNESVEYMLTTREGELVGLVQEYDGRGKLLHIFSDDNEYGLRTFPLDPRAAWPSDMPKGEWTAQAIENVWKQTHCWSILQNLLKSLPERLIENLVDRLISNFTDNQLKISDYTGGSDE